MALCRFGVGVCFYVLLFDITLININNKKKIMAATYENIDPANPPKPQTAKIWKTFGILVAITSLEFICAFTMPRGYFLIFIFVLLTLVKAFFIVAEFMHLKYETKALILSIVVVPVILIAWLTYALIDDGNHFFDYRTDFEKNNVENVANE